MKVKVFRVSGNPVDSEDAKNYKEEWQKGFDELWDNRGDTADGQREAAEKIDKFEKELKDKYNDLTVKEWELPMSGKAWKEKLSTFGNVMITTNAENGELLCVIHDMEF